MSSEQTTQVVRYDVSEAAIATMKARCVSLSASTPKGYEEVRLAIADLRTTRVGIEKRRVELKADALAYGRLVDSEAKRYTALLLEIEEPLSQQKAAVDDAKARVKAEAEAARQRELEAKIRSERDAEEARLRTIREAEEARLSEERASLEAERQRLAAERKQAADAARVQRETAEAALKVERDRLAAEQRAVEAQQRAEREAIEAERRAVAAAREKAERVEFERQAKIQAEAEAVAKAERDRLAAAEQQAKLDALRPDIEKVRAFAQAIRDLPAPKPRTAAGKAMVLDGVMALQAVAAQLETAAERWA